jgi:hypothetical protein
MFGTPQSGEDSRRESRKVRRRTARWIGYTALGGIFLLTGCPPADNRREWVLKKGDEALATFYGFADDNEACREIAAFYEKAAGPGGVTEVRTTPGELGFTLRPTTMVCSARLTWLERLLGMSP